MELEHHGLNFETAKDKTLNNAFSKPTAGVTLARLTYWRDILLKSVRPDINITLPIAQLMKDAQVVIRQQSDLLEQQRTIIESHQKEN